MEAVENDERCPVEATSEIMGRKWVSLIIRDLENGPLRFGELQHSLRISPRILSMRLHELELLGLVSRQAFAEVPPRTVYSLTEKGQLFLPLIEEMRRLGKMILAQTESFARSA
jgi:DNA-binding HxlR family transcriptional regulator